MPVEMLTYAGEAVLSRLMRRYVRKPGPMKNAVSETVPLLRCKGRLLCRCYRFRQGPGASRSWGRSGHQSANASGRDLSVRALTT
jgi:hypothetical protein